MAKYVDLLIDAPISPFSTPAEIRAWIGELDAMLPKFELESRGARTIARKRADALELLREAEKAR